MLILFMSYVCGYKDMNMKVRHFLLSGYLHARRVESIFVEGMEVN